MKDYVFGWAFVCALVICVFAAHAITGGPIYFADGPALLQAAQSGTYVIQPPGYWIFVRLGGLFCDPGFGFTLMNRAFAAMGAVVFYFLCKRLGVEDKIARLASISYISVFFVYFASDVHSTYASQILFPPLLVLTFLRYEQNKTPIQLTICAATLALCTGFRPSDGVFLLPLFAYLVFRAASGWLVRIQFFMTYGLLCLLWFVPSQIALAGVSVGDQLGPLAANTSILLAGITPASIANLLRVLVPLFISFWPLLFVVFFVPRERLPLLTLWILPGLLFFLLVHMADAPYLVYISGAIILAASICRRRRLVMLALTICLSWNIFFYFMAKPLPGTSSIALVINYYGVKYTYFGVSHQWMQTISEALLSRPWYNNN